MLCELAIKQNLHKISHAAGFLKESLFWGTFFPGSGISKSLVAIKLLSGDNESIRLITPFQNQQM